MNIFLQQKYKYRGLIKIKICIKLPVQIYERCKNSKNMVCGSFKDSLVSAPWSYWRKFVSSFHFPLSFPRVSQFHYYGIEGQDDASPLAKHVTLYGMEICGLVKFCAKMSLFVILFSRMDIINMSFFNILFFMLWISQYSSTFPRLFSLLNVERIYE